MNNRRCIPFFLSVKRLVFLTMIQLTLLWLGASSLHAQAQKTGLDLSIGASFGYAPALTYGSRKDAGNLISVFGDLQYQNIIGRLQFTSTLIGSFENENLEGGSAIHGSLGYNAALTDRLRMPLMLTGGAAFINYNNRFNGGAGNSFSDVSPQVGITVAPYFQVTDQVSIQGAARYLKGFAAGNESESIDLTDVSIGIRFTL